MDKVVVNLNTIEKVKSFVNIITKFPCDMDLVASSNRYIIDAKSIMGIFSLDLSKNLNLIIHSEDPLVREGVKNAISEFIVK